MPDLPEHCCEHEKHIEKAEWYLSWKAQDTDQAHKIMNRYKNRPEFELYDIKK